MLPPFVRLSFSLWGLLVASSVYALPLNLGVAGHFNTFVLGDMSHQHADVEGRLAVGGNLTLKNYAIGMQLTDADNNRDSLVVGGTLDFKNGRIYHGNARSGGAASLGDTVGFYAGDKPAQVSGKYLSDNPLDFAAAAEDLKNRAKSYSAYGTTGSSSPLPNSTDVLQLTGNDPLLNVFSLSMEDLTKKRLDLITGKDTWTLINVRGKSGTFTGTGIYFGDADKGGIRVQEDSGQRHDGQLTGRVLFNFFEAETLNLHSIAVPGSILAPSAKVTFYNGHIDGQLIAGSLYGHADSANCSSANYQVCGGQSNHYAFKPIPEPGSVALLLAGGLVLVWRKARWPNRIRLLPAGRC